MRQEIFERKCAKQVECLKQILEASRDVLGILKGSNYDGKIINKRLEKLLPESADIVIKLHYNRQNEPVIWFYNHNRSFPDRLTPDAFGYTTCSYIEYYEENFPLGYTTDENGNMRLSIEETENLFVETHKYLQERIQTYSSAPKDRLKAADEYNKIRKEIEQWQEKYSYISREGYKLSFY